MIAASSAAWLGDLRCAIMAPNSVGAVCLALMGLEIDSDAAMMISLRQELSSGLHAATSPGPLFAEPFVASGEKDRGAKALLRAIQSGRDTGSLTGVSSGMGEPIAKPWPHRFTLGRV
jgi:hypothetical protein